MTESVPLGIMDRSVPSGSHICAFYSGSAGRDEVVLPFLAEGLRTGHKCLAVLDSTSPGEVLAKLYDRGGDADQAAQAGQIEVETPANAYFRSGTFCTDDILTFWGQGISKAKDSGMFAFLRATGEMPSVLNHPDGRTEFFRFEAMLNQFSSPLPLVVLCLYDPGRNGGRGPDAGAAHPSGGDRGRHDPREPLLHRAEQIPGPDRVNLAPLGR